jgi:hypothetical protein
METDRKLCAGVDHAYAQVTAVWCPHEQAWTIIASSWVEARDGEQDGYESRSVRLGPFDDEVDAVDLGHDLLVDRMRLIGRT